jgi:hypothetical protein
MSGRAQRAPIAHTLGHDVAGVAELVIEGWHDGYVVAPRLDGGTTVRVVVPIRHCDEIWCFDRSRVAEDGILVCHCASTAVMSPLPLVVLVPAGGVRIRVTATGPGAYLLAYDPRALP